MSKAVFSLIGFGLSALGVLIVSQFVVISTLRRDMEENRIKAEQVNQLSIERHEQAERDSQERYIKAIDRQELMMKQLEEWRRSLAKQNPDVTVPKIDTKGTKK